MKRFFLPFILVCALFSACVKPYGKKQSRTVFLLGTVCTLHIFDTLNAKDTQAVLQRCVDRIEQLDTHLSANADASTLLSINNRAGSDSFLPIPLDIYPLFERSLFFAENTAGAFNPVIGAIVRLWNIGFDSAHVPQPQDIAATLPLTDYRGLMLKDEAVALEKTGMKLDLGAIAKGFAADETARIISACGIQHALVDLGGTVFALGTRPDGDPWVIGIRNPLDTGGDTVPPISAKNKCIATSGVYERFFEKDGIRYHHIIDPKTGYPVKNNLLSVSVIADSGTDADALSTAFFVLGYDKAVQLLESFPDVEAVFILQDKTIRAHVRFERHIRLRNPLFKFE